MNYKEVTLILNQLNLKPQKRLGQNFLINDKVLNKIISISEISKDDIVLEIGPGLGVITEKIAEMAKKVYAVEIDKILTKYLTEKLTKYDNIDIINEDILNIELPSHNKVISNIPYTITGPIFEKVFFKKNPPLGILLIEKSITNRIFYPSNYKNFSRISVSVNAYLQPTLRISIPRTSFYPAPKIDLSLIKVIPKVNLHSFLAEKESTTFFLKFIAGIMPYKNKNIVNGLSLFFKANKCYNYTKAEINQNLKEIGFENKKLFNFNIEEIIEICRLFYS
ncbi:MAG: 16S rRNA (adenine(1518)-N(6)/adenine(1519)-N(6))-dimethyltransferase RsmA [Promethearchaeota archaeon]|jgi:16S rRNA (adenine1518-N6/adenine1519-N6)-dimethyltransferase